MRHTAQKKSQAPRPSAGMQIAGLICGSILIALGLLFIAASLLMVFEDNIMAALSFLFLMLPLPLGGALLLAFGIREGRRIQTEWQAQSAPTSASPLTAAQPQEQSSPQSFAADILPKMSPKPSSQDKNSSHTVAALISRSNNVFATLKDLAQNELEQPNSKHCHLASMIAASGLLSWEDAPQTEAGRLSRNQRFWIPLSPDELSNEQYETLVCVEAALGLNQDLPKVAQLPLAAHDTQQAALLLMRNMSRNTFSPSPLMKEGIEAAYADGLAEEAEASEWVVRTAIASAAESARALFRVVYQMQVNMDDGLAVIELEMPRPSWMRIVTPETRPATNLARAYILRLATLLAKEVFAASDELTRVVVNAHEHNGPTKLSIDFTPELLKRLTPIVATRQVEDAFPQSSRIRASFGADGWFLPVDAFLELDDESITRAADRLKLPELNTTPSSELLLRTTQAARIADLGINEQAVRMEAWDSVFRRLGDTTEEAVSALMGLGKEAADITVMEACNRTVDALVNGRIETDDIEALKNEFIYGGALDKAVERASALLDENGENNPEAALEILLPALAPLEDMGIYLDEHDCVYRYFGSVAERLEHNLTIDEGGRSIRLVPDPYYGAHTLAAIALDELERFDEAMKHAEECLRIAPTSVQATMRKVRILEHQSRVFEAAQLIIGVLAHANTPRVAAICFYRLAYMQWKLGREDLALACYRRALAWNTEVVPQAQEEMNELLASNDELEPLELEEANALIEREGIPLGCTERDRKRLMGALVACIEEDVFLIAQGLASTIYSYQGDDVLMGVLNSLELRGR